MNLSLYHLTVDVFVPRLRTLSSLLDKGAEHAAALNFDPAVLVSARLAPDMFPLALQVKIACDHARDATARLTGQPLPAAEEAGETLDELTARVRRTIAYVEGASESAFAGAEERDCTVDMPVGRFQMTGAEYLRDWAIPNFYFHLVTAYDILRHNGVSLGKRDFMSHMGRYFRPTPPSA